MKLRTDLWEQVTPEMVLQEALANNHRYEAEPLFSRTGVGSLSSASTKERAAEEARSQARIRKLTAMLKASGASTTKRSAPS